MSTAADDWKKKYFDSLASLEREQVQFKALEAALKRLAGRLCVAGLGQSPSLDDELRKLQAVMRRDATAEELEKLAASLTAAIGGLDRASPSVPPPIPSAAAGPNRDDSNDRVANVDQIRSVLAALIADLRRDRDLLAQADALDAKLGRAAGEQLSEVLASLTGLVGRRIQRLEQAKQEAEGLLSHMVGRLDEIGQFVAAQTRHQDQSLASSETLNVQLAGEMRAMGASVDSAADLSQVRTQVRSRLDSIDLHLQEFRRRESERATAMRAQNEKMQARVAELEAEANRLHDQLKDEQRHATTDPLTNVPNRLAYEQRIEGEIRRFKRFKQPTCLVVWDVDHFKKVNDSYGHRAGDKVLAAVAACLASRLRTTDFLARYGGEEFVTLLCGAKLDDALRVVEELRVAVSKIKMHSGGTPLVVTVSAGVAELGSQDTQATIFDRADKALYRAKAAGRNRSMGDVIEAS